MRYIAKWTAYRDIEDTICEVLQIQGGQPGDQEYFAKVITIIKKPTNSFSSVLVGDELYFYEDELTLCVDPNDVLKSIL